MKKTDWDLYYNKSTSVASITRSYTEGWLIKSINKYMNNKIAIAELGGGNSCFHDAILKKCSVKSYTIYDNNLIGIQKFEEKYKDNNLSNAINIDLLKNNLLSDKKYDLVYSVGLIEHFDTYGTKKVIQEHFNIVKDNGIVIITVPTPTFLYKIIRKFAELVGVWKFHDERPLCPNEVKKECLKHGEVMDEKILWLLGLTQYAIIVKTSEDKKKD